MRDVFSGCSNISALDVSNWDVSQVTSMRSMFDYCQKITSLDVSNWNTSNVTNMSYMFSQCNSLVSLDISNWNTSKVTTMTGMFRQCSSLKTIIGAIDMSSCTDCSDMLYECRIENYSLHLKNVPRSLDLSKIHSSSYHGTPKYTVDNYI